MHTLVIDTATEACSVALLDARRCVAGELRMLGRGHAENLVPMIAALPGRGRAERIVVSLGPGSFTGVRVGIAAARALGLAWRAPVMGYPTLALVAAMARERYGPVPVWSAMTGGHGEWFVAGYAADGEAQQAAASLRPDAAAQACPVHHVAGNQAEALVARRGWGEAIALWPDARCFGLLGDAALSAPHAIYGRPPDAKLPA